MNNWMRLRGYIVALAFLAWLRVFVFSGNSDNGYVAFGLGVVLVLWAAGMWLKERDLKRLRRHARERQYMLALRAIDRSYSGELLNHLDEDLGANVSTAYVDTYEFPSQARR